MTSLPSAVSLGANPSSSKIPANVSLSRSLAWQPYVEIKYFFPLPIIRAASGILNVSMRSIVFVVRFCASFKSGNTHPGFCFM